MQETKKAAVVLSAGDLVEKQESFSHPWNPNSLIHWTRLSRLAGLQRAAVNLITVPPQKESFTYHSHHREEEWLFVLSGRGVLEIGETGVEVSAGDFVGFPTPSVAHHLRNPFEQEVVSLAGGDNLDVESGDFPRLGKRLLREGDELQIYELSEARPFGPLDT